MRFMAGLIRRSLMVNPAQPCRQSISRRKNTPPLSRRSGAPSKTTGFLKIDSKAIVGEGRAAMIDSELACAQLRERLAVNENSASTAYRPTSTARPPRGALAQCFQTWAGTSSRLLRRIGPLTNHHDGGQSPPMMKGACGCLWGRVPVRETSSERSLLVWRSHPDS